jgi:predicted nucleic acid-binding protein
VIVLDTNVVSALMTGDRTIDPWLSRVRGEELYATVMTRAEIRYGLARLPDGKRKDDLTHRADLLFDDIDERLLVFEAKAADRYGQLVAFRQAAGRPISVPDAIIASIVAVNRASLATRNGRDFDGCDIEVVDPFNLAAPSQ